MDKSPFPISLDRNSPVPIYRQLSSAIVKAIRSGELQPDQRLPSEHDFSRRYGIVPMTVRQAMNELVQNGYVYRVQGKGTYVAPRFLRHGLDRMLSFSEDMRARNLQPGSRILEFEICTLPEEIARRLNLSVQDQAIHVKRLRLASGEPVGLHDTFVCRVSFSRQELEEGGSLYQLLASKEVSISEGDDQIESVEADEELGELLNVRPGGALLKVTRVASDQNGLPIEYTEATYRADLYRYSIHLRR